MKRIIVPAAAVLLVGLTWGVFAEPPGKVPEKERANEPAALEKKLLGAWEGRAGCAGNFLFRADGSYELTGYGPAGHDLAGTWKVRWDALPPTLVLTCKTSEVEDEVGKTTEVKLVRLDDDNLAVQHANETAVPYAREVR